MRIEHLEHGSARLWTLLGPFLASRAVHRELTGPIYSAPGVHWWVATEGSGVLGFAALRPTRTAAWYDYAYVVPERRHQGVHAALDAAREAFAIEQHPDLPRRIAVCGDRWRHYAERGWTVASERGSWVHGIRVVGP